MTNELIRSIRQDAWLAVRAFVRTPAFTTVAVLTLALGIGTNTAIFAMAHAVLWRPLPFAAPDQLVLIHETRLDTRVATYASLPNCSRPSTRVGTRAAPPTSTPR